MDCKEAKNLIIARISGDLKPNTRHCHRLETHLSACKACAKEYENAKWTLAFVQRHKLEFSSALQTTAGKHDALADSWYAIEAKIDTIETSAKQRNRLYRMAWKASAVAAGLIISLSLWWVLPNRRTLPPRMATTAAPSVKIEELSRNGSVAVAIGTEIKTGCGELKTLVINDRHRVVMNSSTTISVEPLIEDDRVGCRVDLDLGEILVHVRRDGNPFAVITDHAIAVITGTVFSIKAVNNATTLVVAEGSVQFGRAAEIVQVSSGHLSTITSHSPPTPPASCDAAQLTAWGQAHQLAPAPAPISSLADDLDLISLWPTAVSRPVNLENIHYDTWVTEHREWFRQEFPWIFELQNALAREGVEVDYTELLIKTGDVWQFTFLETIPARFSVIDPNSLVRAASYYSFDKQWLQENVLEDKTVLEKPALLRSSFAGLKAFEPWLRYAKRGEKSPASIFSFHAAMYIAETRSLIWFAVRDGKYDLTDEEYDEVLALLQAQVTAARKCQNYVLYRPDVQKPSCGDMCEKLANNVVGYIETMKAAEEGIAEYDINKKSLSR